MLLTFNSYLCIFESWELVLGVYITEPVAQPITHQLPEKYRFQISWHLIPKVTAGSWLDFRL